MPNRPHFRIVNLLGFACLIVAALAFLKACYGLVTAVAG